MKYFQQQTISEIALKYHVLIPVLEKYSLDFCCRGNKTLLQACTEKDLNLDHVIAEMQLLIEQPHPQVPFGEMNAEQLITHILLHHHFYVRNSMPMILNQLDKLVSKHGSRYSYLQMIQRLFIEVKDDLLNHMLKEEQELFPMIKEFEKHANGYVHPALSMTLINGTVRLMQEEHDHVGQLLFQIRELTNNYQPPQDACTTHRICLEELKSFEKDLHQHIHLENNILFPMALELMGKIQSVFFQNDFGLV